MSEQNYIFMLGVNDGLNYYIGYDTNIKYIEGYCHSVFTLNKNNNDICVISYRNGWLNVENIKTFNMFEKKMAHLYWNLGYNHSIIYKKYIYNILYSNVN